MALAVLLQKVLQKGELKILCGQTFKMLSLQSPSSVGEGKMPEFCGKIVYLEEHSSIN